MPLTTEQKRAALQKLRGDNSPEAQRAAQRLSSEIEEYDRRIANAGASDAKFDAPPPTPTPSPPSPRTPEQNVAWLEESIRPTGIDRVGTERDAPAWLLAGEEAVTRSADALARSLEAAKDQTVEGAKIAGMGAFRGDPSEVGRGLLKSTAGALTGAVQTLPPVAAMTGTGGSLAELMGEEAQAGRALPTGVETLNLPNEAFHKLDEFVGGNVAEMTGNEDAGQLATLATMAALFGGLSKGEAALRGRLPPNVPGSTRPGAVSVRDAGPLVEPGTGLIRRPPSAAPPRGAPPPRGLPSPPRGLPEPPPKGLPEPSGLKPQPDVPPPIPPEVTGPFVNRQLPEPTTTIQLPEPAPPVLPKSPPKDLPRGPMPTGETTPAPFKPKADVPDALPPEAGGATGLETPGQTRPLHRSLQGDDLTPQQRVSGLVDRLLAEDPTADMRIIESRAIKSLRDANEPLLLDDVLTEEIAKRQFEESVEPRSPGATGADTQAEPPPPGKQSSPFRSGKGMGRNRGEGGEVRVPTPKEIWDAAKRGGKEAFRIYENAARVTGNAVQYDRIANAFDFIQGQVARPFDWAATKVGESRVVNTRFGRSGPSRQGRSLRERFQAKEKVVGGPFLDLVRRWQGGEKDVRSYQGQDALRRIGKAIKDLPPEKQNALRDYYQSRAEAPPEGVSQEIIDTIDGAQRLMQVLRERSHELGMLGKDQLTEYERYTPRKFTDDTSEMAREVNRAGGPRIERNFYRRDGMGVIFDATKLRDLDPVAIAKEIDPLAVELQGGTKVGVKFPEKTPSGADNEGYRDRYTQFMERIRQELATERKDADQQLSGAVEGGRKDFARNAAKQRQQARTLNEIIQDTFEPMSEAELAERTQLPLNEALAYGIIREGHRVADGEFFKALAEARDDSGVPYVVDTKTDGYVRMEGNGLGALRGKWVREDVAEYIQQPRDFYPHSEFTNVLIRGIKRALTTLNPDSIMRQYWSVPQFALLMGVKNPFRPDVLRAANKARRAVYKKGSPEFLEAMQEGITGGVTMPEAELAEGSIFGREPMGAGGKLATAIQEPYMFLPGAKRAAQWMGERYGEPDKFARAFGYYLARDIHGMSPREIREFVNNYNQHYGEVGPIVDQARRSPFMSLFAAFRAESPRVMGNTLRVRPIDALLAAAYRHKIKIALTTIGALMAGGDEERTISDDEREFIMQNLGSQKVPIIKDENGHILVGDVRFIDLWGDAVKRPSRLGEGGRGWAEWGLENVGADVTPTIRLGIDLGTGKTKFGERIYNPTDSLDDILWKSMLHATQAFKPRWFPVGVEPNTGKFRPAGWNARQALSAATGEPYAEGRPPADFYQPAIATILGLRITPEDLSKRLEQLEKRYRYLAGNRRTGAAGEIRRQFKRDEITAEERDQKLLDLFAEYIQRARPDREIPAPFK